MYFLRLRVIVNASKGKDLEIYRLLSEFYSRDSKKVLIIEYDLSLELSERAVKESGFE